MSGEARRQSLQNTEDEILVQPPSEGEEGDTQPIVIRMPVDVRSVALTVIAAVGLVLFLQYAQAVLIPIVLGALIFYALDPAVDSLERCGDVMREFLYQPV